MDGSIIEMPRLGCIAVAAPEKETTVAVKIVDMLGEEVLLTKSV